MIIWSQQTVIVIQMNYHTFFVSNPSYLLTNTDVLLMGGIAHYPLPVSSKG